MRKIFKDLMYKRGCDYDYQYDWVLKKAGQKIPEEDFSGATVKPGNIAAAQGKEEGKINTGQKFMEERKDNRANLGHQVVNGHGNSGGARQASAKKRAPAPIGGQYGRNTQGGWAKGQLPVAMQQQ